MLLLVQKVGVRVRIRVRVRVSVRPNPKPGTNPNPIQYEGSFVIVQEITMLQQIHDRIYSLLGVRFPDSKVRSPLGHAQGVHNPTFRTL